MVNGKDSLKGKYFRYKQTRALTKPITKNEIQKLINNDVKIKFQSWMFMIIE